MVARDRTGVLFAHVQTLFHVGDVGGLTDGQLLEMSSTRQGQPAELAFAALVERHGPMVLRACRGLLGDDHDAQDAFQATFLILVRKRDTLWVRDSLGPWLHRVACRVSARARIDADRRRTIERRAAERAADRSGDGGRDDPGPALHEEVDRLPERYRAPIVLCDLEGRTYAEAARSQKAPIGTVKSRLARGRERLRSRLVRRGLGPKAAPPGSGLATGIVPAAIPRSLAISLARASTRSAAGRAAAGPVPPEIQSLVKGALTSMFMSRLKQIGGAAAVAGGLIATAAAVLAGGGPGDRPRDEGGRADRASLAGKIVVFGEADPDVPETYRIRAWEPDGGEPRTVADFPGHAWTGRVSPDGRRIAFLLAPRTIEGDKGIHLWVMDADGRNRTALVEDAGIGGVTCWSPDGGQVVYHRQEVTDGRPAFQNTVVDTATKRAVRPNLPGDEVIHDWSPDGEEWLTGTLLSPRDPTFKPQVYRVRKDGTGRVVLGDKGKGNFAPRFSPDGRRIAFVSSDGPRSSIRVTDRDGGLGQTILEGAAGETFESPCWSPEGKFIAAISRTPPAEEGGIPARAIVVVAAAGGPARRVSPPGGDLSKDRAGISIDWR